MKKIFTLALASIAWMGSMSVMAQEEDMTSYIKNAGFDQDLTWQADGSKKAIANQESKSGRSWLCYAADGSRYAVPKSESSQNRSDGLKEYATNGFIGQIEGWTNNKLSTAGNMDVEWVYFGSVPYSLGANAIPIADDGTGFLQVASQPTDFDGGTGALYMRAGWNGECYYEQVVNLPCAKYRLEYWVINVNGEYDPNESATDLSQIMCRRDVFKEEGGESLNSTTWTKHEFEFTPVSEFTIRFGYKAPNIVSSRTPWVMVDGIKLVKIGEADPLELIESDIYDTEGDLDNLRGESAVGDYQGLYDEIDELIDAAENALRLKDIEKATEAYNALIALYNKLNEQVIPAFTEYDNLQEEVNKLLSTTDYPGKSDLQEKITSINDRVNEANADEYLALVQELRDAIQAYRDSQIATQSDPADYTYLVTNPYFTTADNEPTISYNSDGSVASCDYKLGTDDSYRNGEGWYIGTSGGDQRTNIIGNRLCWNAWRTGSWDVSINQDLTGLKNGYYKISAEMITQPDWVSNQHLFARGALMEAVSPALTEGLWDSEQWTTLTTDWVIVNDGTLTIGAVGSNTNGDGTQMGWFCITNVRLLYGGEASDSEAQAAFSQMKSEAMNLANDIQFAADRDKYTNAIYAAQNMSEISAAKTEANYSIDKYNAVINGSYKDLKEGNYTGKAKEVADKVVGIMDNEMSAYDATYTTMDAKTEVLRAFRDTYLPALAEAEALNPSDASTKQALEASINSNTEKALAISSLPEVSEVNAWASDLMKVISVIEGCEALANGSDDVSAFIANNAVNGNAGWIIDKPVGDGNGAKTGQQYDGDTDGGYLDSYNAEVGALQFTAYQILNVPNGIYELKAMMRASGTVGQEGIYLFATDGGSADMEAKMRAGENKKTVLAPAHIQLTSGTYTDEDYYTDSYGPIWEEAYAAYETGISTELQNRIVEANDGKGRGWFYVSLTVEVTNNALTIGVTNDYNRTQGLKDTEGNDCVPFSGQWYSADNFTLTLLENKQPDYNPATGIETVEGKVVAPRAIYNVAGQRLNKLQKGINIVDGKKVLVK